MREVLSRLRHRRSEAVPSFNGAKPSTASAFCRWAATSRCSARTTTRPAKPPTNQRAKHEPLDPRSYKAQSVPAADGHHFGRRDHESDFRGVFAAIALFDRRAAICLAPVWHSLPGETAWRADMHPGDRIMANQRSPQPTARRAALGRLMHAVVLGNLKRGSVSESSARAWPNRFGSSESRTNGAERSEPRRVGVEGPRTDQRWPNIR